MGSGASLGAAEQVQHLLQIQNLLLNATPMTHCARALVDS